MYYCSASNTNIKVEFSYEYVEEYDYYTIILDTYIAYKPVEKPDVNFVDFNGKIYREGFAYGDDWYSVGRYYQEITLEEYEEYKEMVIDENAIILFDGYDEEYNEYQVLFYYEGDNVGTYYLFYDEEYKIIGIIYFNNDYI